MAADYHDPFFGSVMVILALQELKLIQGPTIRVAVRDCVCAIIFGGTVNRSECAIYMAMRYLSAVGQQLLADNGA